MVSSGGSIRVPSTVRWSLTKYMENPLTDPISQRARCDHHHVVYRIRIRYSHPGHLRAGL